MDEDGITLYLTCGSGIEENRVFLKAIEMTNLSEIINEMSKQELENVSGVFQDFVKAHNLTFGEELVAKLKVLQVGVDNIKSTIEFDM